MRFILTHNKPNYLKRPWLSLVQQGTISYESSKENTIFRYDVTYSNILHHSTTSYQNLADGHYVSHCCLQGMYIFHFVFPV